MADAQTSDQARRRRSPARSIAPRPTPFADALALIKETATAKFDESIDVAVQLGIDAKKSDQVVRGSVVLPAGTGKTVRVAVFAQGAKAEQAKAAGADIVGMEDLAEQVKAGNLNFDIVIASPDTMRIVGQLGQILGPRGLMPNPKVGTVTPDVATAVKNAKAGQVQYRADKAGIVHATIGRASFEVDALKRNLRRADRRAEPRQAGVEQGHLPAQAVGVEHDGHGRPRRLDDGAGVRRRSRRSREGRDQRPLGVGRQRWRTDKGPRLGGDDVRKSGAGLWAVENVSTAVKDRWRRRQQAGRALIDRSCSSRSSANADGGPEWIAVMVLRQRREAGRELRTDRSPFYGRRATRRHALPRSHAILEK